MGSNVHSLPGAANDPVGLLPAHVEAIQLLVPVRFVTIEVAAVLIGLTAAAIRTKIGKAEWLVDRQYVRRDGRVYIDLRGFELWCETGKP